jgi:undecaprenyl pyrophosphate phosphatase UppP
MFFKDIDKWSKGKLRGLKALFSFLHFTALVLIPIIITGVNYKLFTTGGTYKLTAIGVIVVVILGLYAYNKLKEVIDELPQVKLGQQRFKFSVQAILSLIPIVIILVALNLAKSDYLIAINVIKWCSVSFGCAILIDGLFLKYLKAEIKLRSKALELVEVEKRKGLV